MSEWAALLPLAIHLASSQDDYITVGDISLLRQFQVSLFPPLWTLSSVARLLERGTKYLDFASTKGGSSQTVWDVKFGSVFLVANGDYREPEAETKPRAYQMPRQAFGTETATTPQRLRLREEGGLPIPAPLDSDL